MTALPFPSIIQPATKAITMSLPGLFPNELTPSSSHDNRAPTISGLFWRFAVAPALIVFVLLLVIDNYASRPAEQLAPALAYLDCATTMASVSACPR